MKSLLHTIANSPLWRYTILMFLGFGALVWVVSLGPVTQSDGYHAFADTRKLFGVPNFLDVVSNFPFLLIGLLGVRFCARAKLGAVRIAWAVLFAGVGLVSMGSAYYHWSPGSATLVWDRLPMTIGFMGLFVALLGEYVNDRLARRLLVPAVLLGLASVLYWAWSGDLRAYILVQATPLLAIPVMLILFRSGYSHQWLLLVALGWYALAKAAESYDSQIFQATDELISGHTAKHLLAAAGCYSILLMLNLRVSNDVQRAEER